MKLFIHTACMLGAGTKVIKRQTDRLEVNWPMIIKRIMNSVNKSGLGEEPSFNIIWQGCQPLRPPTEPLDSSVDRKVWVQKGSLGLTNRSQSVGLMIDRSGTMSTEGFKLL